MLFKKITGIAFCIFKTSINRIPRRTHCFLLVPFLKCFSFLFPLFPRASWLRQIFRLQSSHFSKNAWNRLQKQVTANFLPLLHLYIFCWSSEKRKPDNFFFFFKERWEAGSTRRWKGRNTEKRLWAKI